MECWRGLEAIDRNDRPLENAGKEEREASRKCEVELRWEERWLETQGTDYV